MGNRIGIKIQRKIQLVRNYYSGKSNWNEINTVENPIRMKLLQWKIQLCKVTIVGNPYWYEATTVENPVDMKLLQWKIQWLLHAEKTPGAWQTRLIGGDKFD